MSDSPDGSTLETKIRQLPGKEEEWNPIITVIQTYNELRKLRINRAAGSDGLPPRLLKAGAETFAPILTHLICLSAETKRILVIGKLLTLSLFQSREI